MVLAVGAQAGIITASTADAQIISLGPGDYGSVNVFTQAGVTEMKAGRDNTSGGRNQTIVIPFLLPDLGAVFNPFVTSFLTFNLNNLNASYSADLYGLAARETFTVLDSDFYMGTADNSTLDATKLEDSILTSSTSIGAVTSADITTWLNSQYAGGANVGDYVFLRISAAVNSSIFPNANNGYTIASATASSSQPFLSYSIPEPSAMTLILATGLGFLFVNRRLKK